MKLPYSLIRVFLVFTAALSLATPAQAWWDGAWSVREKITVDTSSTGYLISDPLGDTTVLIRLHDGDFKFDQAKEDGSDIRFLAEDDKTVLPYQIEKFDRLMGQAFVWVKLNGLKADGKTSFYLYYGNKNAVAPTDAKKAYGPDTALVYHFGENGEAPQDATGNGNNGQGSGAVDQAAVVGDGLRLTAGAPITIAASPSMTLPAGAAMTWSAWIKLADLQPNTVLFSRQDGGASFQIGLDNGIPYVDVGGQRSTATGPALPLNAWKFLAVVATGSQIVVYVDGVSYSTLGVALPALNGPAYLGNDNAGGNGFNGSVDELEISPTARPLGLLKLATVTQGSDADSAAKLIQTTKPEEAGTWTSWISFGYVGVILGSVTYDGWAVVLFLVVMGVMSWRVNIQKYKYLKSIREANAAFTTIWYEVGSDLTVLEDDDKARNLGGRIGQHNLDLVHQAPLYRLYHIGAQEIRKRLVALNGGTKMLSAQSIEAIRASLHSGIELESEVLDDDLIYMRVSISGGPYIGLLGTVVGIMVSFAAITSAGEVNVTAIAPGMSGSLVATAAGLLVAIPALFGYNYLVNRIKKTKTKMRVFVDEFVAKLAESYRPRNGEHSKNGEASYGHAR